MRSLDPDVDLSGRQVSISSLPAGRRERRLALVVMLASAVIFLAAAPFAKLRLTPVWAFIPIYETALVINDLITTVLLLGQYRFSRSRALLVLAGGYLFTAFIAASHALTFPGLFAPTGLLGAGPHTTAWLYMFWHGGFPLLVIGYALLKDVGRPTPASGGGGRVPVLVMMTAVLALVGAFTLLATAGEEMLPALMRDNNYTPTQFIVITSTWAFSLLALATLWWRRPHSKLDVWLMVVMCAWVLDIALSGVLNAARFDLGFYAGRIYGLLAASFVLVALLIEHGTLYARLLEAHAGERRGRAEAEVANRAKSEFLSRMSHELRTPLNAILGFGQLLETGAAASEDRESIDQILRGGRHLLNLINEVLDIARIESGRFSVSLEPVQVGETVRQVVDLARPLADARRIEFRLDGTATYDRYVRADSQRLQQVLLNLVSNAIKYNSEGGRVTIVCQEPEAGRLRLSVTDTGGGIPADLQSRLFTPFERLDASTTTIEGTGLGLALSKRLVEAMGGLIGFDSAVGSGSTFWVDLPEAQSVTLRTTLGEPRVARAPTVTRPGTVLYVEDNVSNLRLVERLLRERSAIRLISAMQGRLGLALAREHRPDLILSDLHLPDISGERLLAEIKADPELQETPVVILSADATRGQIKRLLAAGARAYLTKPLDVAELLALLDETLAVRRGE